jgi:hypothetical protein
VLNLPRLSIFRQTLTNQTNAMSYKALLILIISTLILSGCSFLKRFQLPYGESKNSAITQPVEYRFIEPRRQSLDQRTADKIRQTESQPNTASGLEYYSASGYRCKTLSLTPTASACFVNNQWVAAAPVLIANIP